MRTDVKNMWFAGAVAWTLYGLVCLAATVLWPAGPALAEDEDTVRWVADLGAVNELNEKEPVLVKALFHDPDGVLVDIEKIHVRWERINRKTGAWVVLSAIDTYMKCKVEYVPEDGLYRDPCYGSEYDLHGCVKKGPAKKDLPDYSDDVVEEDGRLMLYREPTD